MNKKTTLSISAIALASILLISGFGLSSVSAQTSSSQTGIKTKVPTSLENKYSVIFQVCATNNTMRAPEVIMSSDSEVKRISLNKSITANTCTTTATTIMANDANTIKIKKVDKSKINTMITVAENKLIKAKSEISKKNAELGELLASIPNNTPTQSTNIQKINEISTKLTELRKELNDARTEYYRLMYILRG